MSQNVTFPIFKATDQDYYQALLAIRETDAAKQLRLSSLSFNLVGGTTIDGLTLETAAKNESLQRILKANGRAIRSFVLKHNNQRNVTISRTDDFQHGEPGQNHDRLALNREQQNFPENLNEHFSTLIAEAQNAVKTFSIDTFAPLLGDAAAKHLAAREEALTRLETLHARVLHDLEETRNSLHEKFAEKDRQLQESFDKRTQQLDEEHQQRERQLTEREAALDERQRQLDDRSSTHVRREIREKLLEKLRARQESFALSPDTRKRRLSVVCVYVFLLLAFAGTAIAYTCKDAMGIGQVVDYWSIGTRIAAGLGFVITAGFFLRWLDRWAQQHADEEFKARQFELDFDRACFLVEMAFEFRAEKGEDIPPHLVENLSTNLFGAKGGRTGHDDPMTATDALASLLLGVGGKAKVAFPFGEVELDKKALDKLSKKRPEEK